MSAFDLSVFWPAFKAAGMLVSVQIEGSNREPFDAGLNRPDMQIFDDAVQSPQNLLEYQSADVPEMAQGMVVVVNNQRYRVSRRPFRERTGFFSQVPLETL